MTGWGFGLGALLGAGALWVLSGTQHSVPVLTSTANESVGALEKSVAAHPDVPEMTRRLAQAYLDARQPGLARVLLDGAPAVVRGDLAARHVLARTLLDEGRADLALEAESGVLEACGSGPGEGRGATCDPVLVASATRRANILRAMVALGVTDALAHPEASLIAYVNATREARIRVE